MVRPMFAAQQEMKLYLNELDAGDRAQTTLDEYEWSIMDCLKSLDEAGLRVHPRMIGRDEIDYLMEERYISSETYASTQVKRLVSFCKWAGNTTLAKMKIGYNDLRGKNVRWLKDEEVCALRLAIQTPIEAFLIHCELDIGMRKIEVRRLTTNSFQTDRMGGFVNILGKGRNGGKWRQVKWHPITGQILEQFEQYRQDCIARAISKNKCVEVPKEFLIYERGGKLAPYGETQLDNFLQGVADRAGIGQTSHHDLRRTCGLQMYRGGSDLVEISSIFGHADIKTTRRYIGLDREDQSKTMAKYYEYQQAAMKAFLANVPGKVQSATSQANGGGTGI